MNAYSDDLPQTELTDNEFTQVWNLARLTGIGFELLKKVWIEHRYEKARVDKNG